MAEEFGSLKRIQSSKESSEVRESYIDLAKCIKALARALHMGNRKMVMEMVMVRKPSSVPSPTLMSNWQSTLKILTTLMAVKSVLPWLIPTSQLGDERRKVQREVPCPRSNRDTPMSYLKWDQPCMPCRAVCTNLLYPGPEIRRTIRIS